MRCDKCGAEVNDNEIYCPFCGNPLNIVPDYSSLESVLADGVNVVMAEEEDDYYDELVDSRRRAQLKEKREAEIRNQKKIAKIRAEKKKKKKKIITICLIVGVLALIGVLAGLFFTTNSYAYQMYQGERAIKSQDYESAIDHFKKAAGLNGEKAAPYDGQGRAYYEQDDYSSAIDVLKKGIEIEPLYPNTYATLCKVYFAQDDLDSITNLFEGVTEEKIFKACEGYYVASPECSVKSGKYDKEQKVKLTCNTSDDIYYTLDGTDPSQNTLEYDKEIELKEQGEHIITAVAINDKGIKSLVSEVEIVLDLPVISSPTVSPATGMYTSDITIEVTSPSNTIIRYTFDGTEPTKDSPVYSKPIYLNQEFINKNGLDSNNIMFMAVAFDKDTDRPSSITKRVYQMVYVD